LTYLLPTSAYIFVYQIQHVLLCGVFPSSSAEGYTVFPERSRVIVFIRQWRRTTGKYWRRTTGKYCKLLFFNSRKWCELFASIQRAHNHEKWSLKVCPNNNRRHAHKVHIRRERLAMGGFPWLVKRLTISSSVFSFLDRTISIFSLVR
jgi:hypothetical protein